MASNTKIMVLKAKEIIYTAIFLAFLITVIVVLILMLSGNKKNAKSTMNHQMNTCKESIALGQNTYDLSITFQKGEITGVSIDHPDEYLETFYPLFSDSMDHVNEMLSKGVPIDEITYNADEQYTTSLILDALEQAENETNTK